MVAKRTDANNGTAPRQAPATTPEGREQQMVMYAFDLAEKQLREGTASAQVITHFLKFGSSQNKLEQELLRKENLLRQTKVDQIKSSSQNSELYEEVVKMMRVYSGEEATDLHEDF